LKTGKGEGDQEVQQDGADAPKGRKGVKKQRERGTEDTYD